MDQNLRSQAYNILTEALELPLDERRVFVEEQCGGDPQLQEEVAGLLNATEEAGAFMEEPVFSLHTDKEPFALVGQSLSHYEVLEKLGAGGMGEVYVARDLDLDREVALKVLPEERSPDPERLERFAREARALAALNHPNIVTIYTVEEAAGLRFLTMELVEGSTLGALIPPAGMPLDRFFELAVPLADALSAAHESGIIHRDLKPTNIMVSKDDRVKVLDFGLAKHRQDRGTSHDVTPTAPLTDGHRILGTLPYMSPEHVQGRGIDHRSDLFSLGIILYEMATGQRPFKGETSAHLISAILRDAPKPLVELKASLPTRLASIVQRCLEKSPQDRFSTALAVRDELKELRSRTLEAAPLGVGERRQMTLLCCDLVSVSAAATASLDPETLAEVMPEFQTLTHETMGHYEGHIGSVLGHVVVYFGYPRAHEDDSRRAVHAALELVGRVAAAPFRSQRELGVRVSVHTGPAVIMPGPSQREQVVLGETLQLAGDLLSLTMPQTVSVSRDTHRLIGDFFDCQALAFSNEVFQVLRPTGGQRLDKVATSTPMVARQVELDLLMNRWQLARGGTGQGVLLRGEAGIGKSRLIHTLQRRLSSDAPHWFAAHGSPYNKSSPLYPVIGLLRRALEVSPSDSPRAQLRRLDQAVGEYRLPQAEVVPLFASLLSLPGEETHALPPELSPEAQKNLTLEALWALLREMADRRPMVLVVEDLHWVDPSTLELLGLILDRGTAAPLLLLLTCRPEFEAPWGHRAELTQLTLTRLTDSQVERLIHGLTGEKTLPDKVRRHILEKTDGVPLFVEELTKAVLELDLWSKPEDHPELADLVSPLIPATLRDSLTARLDRLGTAKEVAQLGAVMGREFPYPLLAAVSGMDETTLQQELRRLEEAGLVLRKGFSSAHAVYTFKHGLIQDAAYESLLKAKRQQIHHQIAATLEERSSTATAPELLARHFEEGGRNEQAIHYGVLAGQRAIERSAHIEAVRHCTKAIELLRQRPPSTARNQQEIGLLLSLFPGLTATEGYGAEALEKTCARARQLCTELGESQRFPVLYALWTFHLARGDRDATSELATTISVHAQSSQDPPGEGALTATERLVTAESVLGTTAFYAGDFVAAQRHLARSLEVYDPSQHVSLARNLGTDPGLFSRLLTFWCLWFTGHPDQARLCQREALILAEGFRDRFSHAATLIQGMGLRHLLGEVETVQEGAERAIALALKDGFRWWLGFGTCERGWVLLERGEVEAGIAEIEQGLAIYRSTGGWVAYTYYSSYLVDAYLRVGRAAEGLKLVDEALALVEQKQDRFYEAELHRLKGELLLLNGGDEVAAEGCFRKALKVARRQDAKGLELRACTSLGRLLRDRGETAEARGLLSAIYGWFAEGFDTRDLRQARALVDELAAVPDNGAP